MLCIWGQVDREGKAVIGTGFTSTRERQGRYRVQFDRPFAHPAVVVVTQVKDLQERYGKWYDDNILVVDPSPEGFLVAVRDLGTHSGGFEDDAFNFIAMGAPAPEAP
jgi:hypothetical protein